MSLSKAKIVFFRSMSTMLEAGVPVTRALRGNHPSPLRRVGSEMAAAIERSGGALADQFDERPSTFSSMERQLIAIGERTGRLEMVFNSLADWHERRRRLVSQLISGLAYPTLLYHFAAVMIPLISFLIGATSLPLTLVKVAAFLVPPYVLAFGAALALSLRRNCFPDSPLPGSGVALHLPLLGSLIRSSNYGAFFSAYALGLNAGLGVAEAARLAAGSCGNRVLRNEFLGVAERVETHSCPFHEAFAATVRLSGKGEMAATMMESGETAGKSVETAERVAAHFREEAEGGARLLIGLVPKLIYIVIVIYVAVLIVSYGADLVGKTTTLLEGGS